MQRGYALPIRVGSKLLMKCTKTECEYFNRKVFDRLDKVKDMEDRYKLSDPASVKNNVGYHDYGPIGVIAWAQKIHSKFLSDHKWPGIASKLSHLESAHSNYVQTKVKFTCYYCKEDGRIKPNCPKLQAGVPKTYDKQKERRPLSAWRTVRPKDLTKVFIDENKVEWSFCTKRIDFTTKKKDIWSCTHSDAKHKTSSRTTPEDAANLTLIETDVPIGPPLATNREPSLEVEPNDLVFTPGAWCCPIPLVLASHNSVTHVPCPIDCQYEDITILGIRRDDNSSDDDSSDDEISSDDEESVALDEGSVEIDPLFDNEPIINQTTENQEH
jgi:hypothetical protein